MFISINSMLNTSNIMTGCWTPYKKISQLHPTGTALSFDWSVNGFVIVASE